jgi:hypothetical protein
MIDFHAGSRTQRHAATKRIVRILNYRQTATALKVGESSGAIIERTRQDFTDRARTVSRGGRTEQRADRGSDTAFARSALLTARAARLAAYGDRAVPCR